MQPECPDHPSISRAESFSGKYGSPAFPKIDSTKSKLLTKFPGAKKRISILFLELIPGTSGLTGGRNKRETNISAFSF